MHLAFVFIWIVAGVSGARYLKDNQEDSVHQDLNEINIEGKLSLGESKIDEMKANVLQMKSDMAEMKDNNKVMESRIASMEDDMKEMKSNMKEMRDLLVQLVGREKKEQ